MGLKQNSVELILPRKKSKISIAVLESTGPSMLLIDSINRSSQYEVKVFSDPAKLEAWIFQNFPALVILPLGLREDLIRVAPLVKLALNMKLFSKLKFIAVSDLEQKFGNIPAAQDTLRMLQGIMEFVSIKTTVSDFIKKIDSNVSEFDEDISESETSREYFFFRGKESPQTVVELLEAYDHGIKMLKRMITATDCALIALDSNAVSYSVIRSTNQEHNDGNWDLKCANIIPRRDIITSNGFYFFQPIKNYIGNSGKMHSYGFVYIFREKARLPMNTDQESLVQVLTKEIQGISQTFVKGNRK